MHWSTFAHLPTSREEYYNLLIRLKNGMTKQDVDCIIASVKCMSKVQNHYRGNLIRVGLISLTSNNTIQLNYNSEKLKLDKSYLSRTLFNTIEKNDSPEIRAISSIVLDIRAYDYKKVIDILLDRYPLTEPKSLNRWIRPIVLLIEFADFLEQYLKLEKNSIKIFQEKYLNIAKEYGKIVPLKLIEMDLLESDAESSMLSIINQIVDDSFLRYKIELLMMPDWATIYPKYKISTDRYTHIKIKSNLLLEE